MPDWVPLVGGTAVGGLLPEMGINVAFVLTIPLAVLVLGYVFVRPARSPADAGGDDIPLVIASLGLALLIQYLVREAWGPTRAVPVDVRHHSVALRGILDALPTTPGVLAVCIAVILALQMFLRRTWHRRQMEATAQSPHTGLGCSVSRRR